MIDESIHIYSFIHLSIHTVIIDDHCLSLSLCHYVSTYQFSVFFLSASPLSIGPLIRVSFLWMMLESALCKTDSSVSSSLSLSLECVSSTTEIIVLYRTIKSIFLHMSLSRSCFHFAVFSLVLKATTSYENLVLIRSGRNSLEVWRQKGNFRPNWGSAEVTPLFPKNWFELQKLGFKASTSSGFDQHWWEMDRTGKFSKQHVVFTGNSSVNLWWDLILGQVFSTCFPGRP